MANTKNIAALLALCILTACGGGGDDGSGNAEPKEVSCATPNDDPFCRYDNPPPVIKPGG
jgi:hypothetical protein